MREFGVRPNRELGQNFLVDDNILEVIGRAAELDPSDVVLEVGGGLGVLSEYLAERVAHLHVVEVDRSLEPALRDALDPFGERVTLYLTDAAALAFGELEPIPNKVVANLPYGVAASVIIGALGVTEITLVVGMVQREVGERLAAAPGSKIYGVTSVLAQLSGEVKVVRKISANVFFPVPNVESSLVLVRRGAPPPDGWVIHVVHGAFAHRRKTLAGSLELAYGGDLRERARAALPEIGQPADARAERLSPQDFVELAERLR
jgi:16S rRNA (adenine1518-N6/adenine1519-N6)-dimethyltransferase